MVRVKYDQNIPFDQYRSDSKEIWLKPYRRRRELIHTLFHEYLHYLLCSLHVPSILHELHDYLNGEFRLEYSFPQFRIERKRAIKWKLSKWSKEELSKEVC